MVDFEMPWVEKFRPQVLEDVVGNERTVSQLNTISAQGNMPNLLLVGPPGCGKTTSIWCLARQMLGETARQAVCELNASDDRGIDVVREKIKSFAQQKVNVPPNMHKIIILDEADSMTASAQQALRMIMTDYTSTTRFALACNDSSKIIEAIQSRCAILRFTRLSDPDVLSRLMTIIKSEEVKFEDKGLEALIFTAEGDMRNAINNLQATVSAFGLVSFDNVFQVCDQPHPDILRDVISRCLESQFSAACGCLKVLWIQGYSPLDIIGSLYKVVTNYSMNENLQLKFLKELAILRMRLLDGVCTLLQVHGCLAKLCELSMAN
jgi:replication factor C subunit 2/4